MFQQETGIAVKPIAVGTGAALEMARRGDADAVLVHAPEVERKYVQSGDIIDGPADHVQRLPDHRARGGSGRSQGEAAIEAMKAIAAGGSFVSRGDGSGTETKELALWKAAGVVPGSIGKREETGQGMGATLLVAEQRQTYTLTDRATYLAFKDKLTLVPLVQGDPELRNVYSAYAVNPGKNPAAKRSEALRFVRYLTEPKVQEWIGRYGTEKVGRAALPPGRAGVGQPLTPGALTSVGVRLLRFEHRSVARQLDLPQDVADEHLHFTEAVIVIVGLDGDGGPVHPRLAMGRASANGIEPGHGSAEAPTTFDAVTAPLTMSNRTSCSVPLPEGADGVLGSGVHQEGGLDGLPVGDARLAGLDRLPERYFRLREGVLQFGDPRSHPIGCGAGGEEDRGGGRDQEGCSLIRLSCQRLTQSLRSVSDEGAGEAPNL